VQLAAGYAFDHFIFVVRNIIVVVETMLNIQICIWASENKCCHPRFASTGDRYLCYVTRSTLLIPQEERDFPRMDIVFGKGLGLAWCADVFFSLSGELATGRGNALQAWGSYLPAIRIEWTQLCPI
jgi:hypothetical protein